MTSNKSTSNLQSILNTIDTNTLITNKTKLPYEKPTIVTTEGWLNIRSKLSGSLEGPFNSSL